MDIDVQPSFDGSIPAHSPGTGQTTLPAQAAAPASNQAAHIQSTPSHGPTLPQTDVSYNPEIATHQGSNRMTGASINLDPQISAPQDFASRRPKPKRPVEDSRSSTNRRPKKVFLTSEGTLEMIDEPNMEAQRQELQDWEEKISLHKRRIGEELHTRMTQVSLEMQKVEERSKALEDRAKQAKDWERQLAEQKLQMAGQSGLDGRVGGQSALAGRYSASSATPRKSHRYRNHYTFEEAGYEPDIDETGKNRVTKKIAKRMPKHRALDYNLRTKRIRNVFMSFFNVNKSERGFRKHVSASKEDVKAYERDEHDGPSASDCRIDILDEENLKTLPEWLEKQVRDLIFRKIRRAASICRAGMQPTNESEDDEMEIEEEYAAENKSYRHKMRQRTLFKQRLQTCERKLGTATCWDFLSNMIATYGVEGMSSDETGDDETYHIKIIPWRREIENYLNFIDSHRKDVVTKRGTRPRQRIRDGQFTSERNAALKLPRSFYDEQWLAIGRYKQDKVLKAVSEDVFKWMEIRSSQN